MAKKTRKIKEVKEKKEVEDISELINFKKIDKSWWITIGIIIVIIIAVIIGFAYVKGANNFNYKGINFNKTLVGKIIFYTANVPAIDSSGRVVQYVNIDFRSKPSNLEDIPVQTLNGIRFMQNKTVYIIYDDLKVCDDNGIAALNFYGFMDNFGLKRIAGLTNKTQADKLNFTYATCQTKPGNTVINILNGNRTEIVQTSNNCYQLIAKDCDVLRVMEKFELQLLQEYVSDFRKI